MEFLKCRNCVHILNWNYLIKWVFWAFRKLSVCTKYHKFLFSINIFIILPYIYFILELFSSWTYVLKICLYFFLLNIVLGYSSTFFNTVFRHVIHSKSQHQWEIDFLDSLDSEWWLLIGLIWWLFWCSFCSFNKQIKAHSKVEKIL